MKFYLIPKGHAFSSKGVNEAYLRYDSWNDYSFVTMFHLLLYDENGVSHQIGNVKIGFRGQTTNMTTHTRLSKKGTEFEKLTDEYFSLGQDIDFYKSVSKLSEFSRRQLLEGLNDIVANPKLIDVFLKEDVFKVSLLREVSLSIIKGQFARILAGNPPLTTFKFSFVRPKTEKISDIRLDFKVEIESKPSTNIHAIIGRNGVGKTFLLNGMIDAIVNNGKSEAKFYDMEGWQEKPITSDYFSSLVSVSFSAFDPFEPPREQPDPSLGTCYFYVGLKKENNNLKLISEIHNEFSETLQFCFNQKNKQEHWLKAIKTLESDDSFAMMELAKLAQFPKEELKERAMHFIRRMSTGHAIVLFTLTHLIARVEEKTLVIMDEPECHLHPPLLSAFIRALSELLYDRNGVSILATHSPVVLQEVPKSNVWKMSRIGLTTTLSRPDIETFGENVGVLTREVFGLEVVKSGFHDLLVKSIKNGDSYKQIISEYKDQLGLEARALLKSLIVHRDRNNNQ